MQYCSMLCYMMLDHISFYHIKVYDPRFVYYFIVSFMLYFAILCNVMVYCAL